jgi:hypothetical protein
VEEGIGVCEEEGDGVTISDSGVCAPCLVEVYAAG